MIIPYTTLTGADDHPGELAGYGPIPADLAREIAADAVWKRLLIDPESGTVLDHGRSTYRPPTALTEFVRARDGACRSPICTRRAINCELDHIIAWSKGGTTSEPNLMNGCIHHHHLKHQPGWKVLMINNGGDGGGGRKGVCEGVIEWITPTGHRYRSDAHDYRPLDDRDPALVRRAKRARHDPHTDPLTSRDLTPAPTPAAMSLRTPGSGRDTPGTSGAAGAGNKQSAAEPFDPVEPVDPVAEYEDRSDRERLARRAPATQATPRTSRPRFTFRAPPPPDPDQPSTDEPAPF